MWVGCKGVTLAGVIGASGIAGASSRRAAHHGKRPAMARSGFEPITTHIAERQVARRRRRGQREQRGRARPAASVSRVNLQPVATWRQWKSINFRICIAHVVVCMFMSITDMHYYAMVVHALRYANSELRILPRRVSHSGTRCCFG